MRNRLIILLLATLPFTALGQAPAAPSPATARAEAATLPDVLDCGKLSWMENCEAINRQLQENPSAPARIVDRSGLEFNFAPDTPSAMIHHMLDPTPQSAKALVDYYEQHWQRASLAAVLWRQEMARRGGKMLPAVLDPGLNSAPSWVMSETAMPTRSDRPIIPANVRVYVFFDSNCPVCQSFVADMREFRRKHPDIYLSVLHIDNNQASIERLRGMGLTTRYLDGPTRTQYLSIIERTPTIWVQSTRTNETQIIPGRVSVSELEAVLAEVSNAG